MLLLSVFSFDERKNDGQTLETKVDGHHFEVWVPANERTLHSIWLKASMSGDEQLAYKRLNAFELRQASIDGIQLSLQVPTRQVEVKVTDSGKPVSGAKLKAGLNSGTELQSITDDNGIVRLKMLPHQTLTHLTASVLGSPQRFVSKESKKRGQPFCWLEF